MFINKNYLNYLKGVGPLEKEEATRVGFGNALHDLGQENKNTVCLCADLTESLCMDKFKNSFPERFFEMGIAEQNMASVASGMASMGALPFIGSYAMFSPGRNWEQIRTNILYNNKKVIIVGGHAGLSVGPDGGTHQALEDISIMRVLPNINIFSPSDSMEAYYFTKIAGNIEGPVYIRLAREKSPIMLNYDATSALEEQNICKDMLDFKNMNIFNVNSGDCDRTLSIFVTGPIMSEVLKACVNFNQKYKNMHYNINVYNINILKFANPNLQSVLETKIISILKSSSSVITVEEHQIIGGLGSMISEISTQHMPRFINRIGVKNRFGQSGKVGELYKEYNLDALYIENQILEMIHK